MRLIALLLTLLPLLTGCGATAGNCDLLPLPAYQVAEEKLLADELDTAQPGAVWPWRVVDYYRLRDAVAACRG